MARSHVEMAHVLGLQDNPFLSEDNTGWFIGSAVVSIKNRYKQLKNSNNSDLNFDVLPSSYYRDAAKKLRICHMADMWVFLVGGLAMHLPFMQLKKTTTLILSM